MNSFILFKPDAMNHECVIKEIHGKLKESNLKIIKQLITVLEDAEVECMWPKFKNDVVTLTMLKKYVMNKELLVYLIEGEEAIQKIIAIKKYIRKKYAHSDFIINCIHTPENIAEYKDHLDCIFKNDSDYEKVYTPLIKTSDYSRFLRYSSLEKRRLVLCAEELWSQLRIIDFKKNYHEFMEKSQRYILFLVHDSSHTLTYVVAVLFEFFKSWEVEDSYIAAFATKTAGEYPIFSSDSYEEISGARDYLESKNLTAIISQ